MSNDPPGLPRIVVCAGEPAGIGPELVLALAETDLNCRLACVADPVLLRSLAKTSGKNIQIAETNELADLSPHQRGILYVLPCQLDTESKPGQLDPANARYVLECLDKAIDACVNGDADAMVTAPLQKSVINDAGIAFTGHTEYLAQRTSPEVQPVMLLASRDLRVALATTHLALRDVPDNISSAKIEHVIEVVARAMREQFSITEPRIAVCGLNPHAGENGHFGREEIETIAPAVNKMRARGVDVSGPFPGDTAFTPSNRARYDCFISMFHDQGLPVIKALSFGEIVNVTLGLPIVRTSVDHGTGLDIAGRGLADPASLIAAIQLAAELKKPVRQ